MNQSGQAAATSWSPVAAAPAPVVTSPSAERFQTGRETGLGAWSEAQETEWKTECNRRVDEDREQAADVAKESFKTGKTVRQVAQERKFMGDAELNKALDARRMTQPQADMIGSGGG